MKQQMDKTLANTKIVPKLCIGISEWGRFRRIILLQFYGGWSADDGLRNVDSIECILPIM